MIHFLRAYTDLQTVTILEGQESYKLLPFCKANCIVVIDEEVVDESESAEEMEMNIEVPVEKEEIIVKTKT